VADRQHSYRVIVRWTGNEGVGTASYRAFGRAHDIAADGRPSIQGSSDPAFRGDATRWNPEQMLLASLSACHQLWYLHLCSANGIVVTGYEDEAEGLMTELDDGGGQFTSVLLHPHATLAAGTDIAHARALHHDAHAKCFIARSVNFPVNHDPRFTLAET
jgi:organic hydroperoxide reductase OsmC/OhrA